MFLKYFENIVRIIKQKFLMNYRRRLIKKIKIKIVKPIKFITTTLYVAESTKLIF